MSDKIITLSKPKGGTFWCPHREPGNICLLLNSDKAVCFEEFPENCPLPDDKPECDHDFQPVYNKGQPQLYRFNKDTPTSRIAEILEATKAKTFVGCYCRKCGKIINTEAKK